MHACMYACMHTPGFEGIAVAPGYFFGVTGTIGCAFIHLACVNSPRDNQAQEQPFVVQTPLFGEKENKTHSYLCLPCFLL